MSKKYISILDIVGPVMIGPSSSHTAGAAKIGYEAYRLLGEAPDSIKIKLFNSFSDTGKGHKTDLAVLGGCLGITPEDEQIIKANEIAEKQNVKYKISWGYHSPDFHPNTAVVKLQKGKKKVALVGYSIGGGRIQIAKCASNLTTEGSEALAQIDSPLSCQTTTQNGSEKYFTFKEIKEQVSTTQQFYKLALITEAKAQNQSEKDIFAEFTNRYQIMLESIDKGIKNRTKSDSGLFGGDANRIWRSKYRLLNKLIEDGITYAIATAEHNARMGKIVASPTAGACGVVPGVFRALQEKFHFSNGKMAEALIIAGAIGAIIANKMALAGAVAGCQAEIGVAGCMAAGAGVHLMGGSLEKLESATSLVMGNVLGLTCDPVMGLVEVPCILRNGAVTSLVFTAIELAMDGVAYVIPFDEIVDAAKKIGDDMHPKYKETSLGGLAETNTAKQICLGCQRKCKV